MTIPKGSSWRGSVPDWQAMSPTRGGIGHSSGPATSCGASKGRSSSAGPAAPTPAGQRVPRSRGAPSSSDSARRRSTYSPQPQVPCSRSSAENHRHPPSTRVRPNTSAPSASRMRDMGPSPVIWPTYSRWDSGRALPTDVDSASARRLDDSQIRSARSRPRAGARAAAPLAAIRRSHSRSSAGDRTASAPRGQGCTRYRPGRSRTPRQSGWGAPGSASRYRIAPIMTTSTTSSRRSGAPSAHLLPVGSSSHGTWPHDGGVLSTSRTLRSGAPAASSSEATNSSGRAARATSSMSRSSSSARSIGPWATRRNRLPSACVRAAVRGASSTGGLRARDGRTGGKTSSKPRLAGSESCSR